MWQDIKNDTRLICLLSLGDENLGYHVFVDVDVDYVLYYLFLLNTHLPIHTHTHTHTRAHTRAHTHTHTHTHMHTQMEVQCASVITVKDWPLLLPERSTIDPQSQHNTSHLSDICTQVKINNETGTHMHNQKMNVRNLANMLSTHPHTCIMTL